MEDTGYKRCRNLMIFFNVLFLLGGTAITGLGIWILVDFASFSATVNANSVLFQYAAYIAIGAGGITMIISILGCVGALKEIKCLLIIFITILVLLSIAELAIVILAFAFTSQFEVLINAGALSSIIVDYGSTTSFGVAATTGWDSTQGLFKCCGYNGASDYTGSFFDSITATTNPWPLSCCAISGSGGYVNSNECLGTANPSSTSVNLVGCSAAIRNLVFTYSYWVGGVAAGVLFLQILAITFACCVTSNMGTTNRVGNWG